MRRIAAFAALLVLLVAARDAAAQFPLGGVVNAAKNEVAIRTVGGVLNAQLPLKLDAKAAFPTVDALPGGPFSQSPTRLSPESAQSPLAPGDYVAQVFAYCTEYSAHLPGHGLAYKLAPLQGKATGAIATLLWRGTYRKVSPSQLQAVAWAIQSGLTYGSMPQSYQALITQLIPEYKAQLSGDFVQQVQDSYQSQAQNLHLPSLDSILGGMGTSGQLMLSAERQRSALLAAGTSDQMRTQTLFAGQESGVTAPVNPDAGAWTVRVPGAAYVRFVVMSGNMQSDNLVQVRIAPNTGTSAPQAPTLSELLNGASSPGATATGMIGYSQGAPAQALIPVLPPPTVPLPATTSRASQPKMTPSPEPTGGGQAIPG